ncbi:MAG TPA: tetratricopeptide repeat protein [Vicinamibacterales bacterium]|nr:tetratricopeptide repeat protein [Vicinamibacterales bacterium]
MTQTSTTETTARRRRTRSVVMVALSCVSWLAAARAGAEPPAAARVLVMPFENVTRDPKIFWLGEGAAVLLTDDLLARGVHAIARDERQQAFDRLQVPPAASLTDATIIRVGQLVGAADVIMGSLQLDGDDLVLHARGIALEAGRVKTDVTERGALPDLVAIVDRIAAKIAPADPPPHVDEPALPVFESYIKGLLAETPDTAIGYLTGALTLQPAFDRARLALWQVYDDQGDQEQALAAIAAVPATSRYAERARFLAGLSQLYLKKYDEAFATLTALADVHPAANVWNDLGVVQLRRGNTPQTGTPAYYFTKAADADPADSDYLFNLGYAYWLDRDTQAAIYWLREAVRRDPADGDAHFVLGAALAAAGNGVEASRERELARRLSATYEARAKRPGGDAVPRGLERVKDEIELPHANGVERTLATNEQRSQDDLARFYLDSGRRQFEQEHDRQATDDLNRALYLSPYLAEAHLLLGRIHLRNGRVREAIDAFKIALWSQESADAHAALGEAYRQNHDPASARAEAERALAIDPTSAAAKRLLAALDAR